MNDWLAGGTCGLAAFDTKVVDLSGVSICLCLGLGLYTRWYLVLVYTNPDNKTFI
jgi:hypothetical protein